MYLSVIDKGMSISLTNWVEGRKEVVTLKTYSDKGRASNVLSMSRKAGMSVENVIERLLPPKEDVPLELTEEVLPIPEESPPSVKVCKKCGSADLIILKKANRNKLVCNECLTYQKFLSKADAETFLALQGK